MGRSSTPKYRLEVRDQSGNWSSTWERKATMNCLEDWLYNYVQSLKKGGVNHKLSLKLGFIPIPIEAKIILQRTGEVIRKWSAPMFWVI